MCFRIEDLFLPGDVIDTSKREDFKRNLTFTNSGCKGNTKYELVVKVFIEQ